VVQVEALDIPAVDLVVAVWKIVHTLVVQEHLDKDMLVVQVVQDKVVVLVAQVLLVLLLQQLLQVVLVFNPA
jgi:hypothetical protein